MVEITFVRHGQAQTGAKDEASYDSLSDLGQQQAGWLGEHFAASHWGFDHVFAGNLTRQKDTAKAICAQVGGEIVEDARLRELDYFGLAASLKKRRDVGFPTDRASFIAHVPQVLAAWEDGDVESDLESFRAFEARIRGIIDHAEQLGGRVLCVTSGGVIGMATRILLDLHVKSYAKILLQVHNTSVHRYVKAGETLVLDTFNATPHLESPDRLFARTYV